MSTRAGQTTGCVAIIPARGGSKRIPRKNIKPFCGRPIIQYAIEAAFDSSCFEEVMVSTDDDDIATVARENHASVPFLRSRTNADDHSTLIDVMLEVVERYRELGRVFDYYCCILPTSPLLTAERIREGYKLLEESQADSMIAVVRFSYPIQRAFKMTDGARLEMIWPENLLKRSQDLPPAFHDAGQFYWGTTLALAEKRLILTENTVALEIPEHEAQDIDTEEDWALAELKYKLAMC